MEVIDGEDRISITPVTDLRHRVTYSNIYCAYCNTRTTHPEANGIDTSHIYRNFAPWNTTFHCWETTRSAINVSYANLSTQSPINDDRISDKEVAERLAKFDPQSKKIISLYKGKLYQCRYFRNPPPNITDSIRNCIPSISKCPSTIQSSATSTLCQQSTTSVVYAGESGYRNVHCAACNGKAENLTSCNFDQNTRLSFSTIFTTGEKAAGGTGCKDPQVSKKFCS